MDPGKQLNPLRTGAVVSGVINNQHLLSFCTGQDIEESSNDGHQIHHKLAPVVPGGLEEVIRCIFLESQVRVSRNPLRKVYALKGQRKDDSEQGEWRYASQLPDSIAMQQSSDLQVLDEGRNPVLLLVDPGNVEYSSCEPFLFDIIEFFTESNIPENKRLFTLICNDFSWLMHFIVVLLSTPKLEILQHKSES